MMAMVAVAQETVKKTTTIYLENAETLSYDEENHPDAQILRGYVQFRHEDALMYCDSAYFFQKTNSLDAFGNVRMVQGDSIEGFADILYYDGNTKFARMYGHVKLIDNDMEITTDTLLFDRRADFAWYYTGGKVVDSVNTLTSRWGQYQPKLKQALFRGDVHLVNDKFVMDAATMKYNTETNVTDMEGNTKIVYENETNIYTTLGWYNTKTEKSMLLNRSRIEHVDGTTLTGDTIFYDKVLGYGRMVGDIVMVDSTNHLTLQGNLGEMYENGPMGKNSGFATDSALLIDWSDSLSYTYIHGDTLYTEEIEYQLTKLVSRDSILVDSVMMAQSPDTMIIDTAYRQTRARHHVRIFRDDLQALGDSCLFNGRDSILSMFGEPIAWTDRRQISAETIDVYMKNGVVDYTHSKGKAMAIEQEHPLYYNQMAGKEMFAYIRNNELAQLDVNGNAETIFFPRETDGTFIGMNKTESSNVKLFFEKGKIHHVLFLQAPKGSIYPMTDLENASKLSGFFWAEEERPVTPGDVFRHAKRTERSPSGPKSAAEETPANAKPKGTAKDGLQTK